MFVTGRSIGGGSFDDYATIKYSAAGVPLWTNRYNGPGNDDDEALAVAVDGGGNVFVTGGSLSGFGPEYATIKYSSAGVPLWTNRYGGDVALAVAVDGSGNVFVTGESSFDYVTVAYSGAGVPLWTNRYNGPGNNTDDARAMAVDGSGNVFVTGSSIGSDSHDYATIKYSITLPWLTINRTAINSVVVSWPSAWTGFTLQQNSNVNNALASSDVSIGVQDDGTTKTLIVNPPSGNRFFRLNKP